MKAIDIIAMLEKRHSKDVILTEISLGVNRQRMDAWAMIPSYSGGFAIGYEIKVTRSDFLHDRKMQDYLAYCHQAYLVVPSLKIASIDELPDGYGLLVVAGSRLLTKVKAPVRQVDIPEDFYQALITNRLRRDYNAYSPDEMEIRRRVERVGNFKDYLEGKRELKDIGYAVSEKLDRDIRRLRTRELTLEGDREVLNDEKKAFQELVKMVEDSTGIDIRSSLGRWGRVEDAASKIVRKLTAPQYDLFVRIEALYEDMLKLKKEFDDGQDSRQGE